MPKRSNDFQQLIYLLHHQLAYNSIVTESKFLHDKAVGVDREVDVVIETQVGDYIVTVSVECQKRGRVADVEWVEQMATKHETLTTDKLILVSKSGFTQTAHKKADALRIVTMTISQAVQADWAGLVGKPDVLLMRWAIDTSACFGILAEPDGEVASVQLDLDQQLHEQHGEETLAIRETIDLLVAENPEHIVEQLGGPKAGDKASHVIFRIQSGLPDGTYILDEAGAKKAIRGLYAIGHAMREVERVDLDSGSFGAAQVAYGRTRMIDTGSTISIVEHEGGPNTAAILLPPHDERHIVDLWSVD